MGHRLWCKKVQWVNAVGSVSTAYCFHCIHWFRPFCTKDNVPTTIYHYSTASTAYCIHCMIYYMGWPFCTKGNGPHHPYLLSTLCKLIFLHQNLLHPVHLLHSHCFHCYPTCPTFLTFLHLQSVPPPTYVIRNSWNHYEPKTGHFQPIPDVPSTNPKSAKTYIFFAAWPIQTA